MPNVILNCHPAAPCTGFRRFEAGVEQLSSGELRFHYRIEGDLEGLSFPEQITARRRDELWRHTCCEAFLRADRQAGYYEYNFSPSTAWALYRFSAYRKGMAAVAVPRAPRIVAEFTRETFDLEAVVDLKPWVRPNRMLFVGLCAVIETRDGALSYWAMRHPPGRPDFHRPDAWALELPPGAPMKPDRPGDRAYKHPGDP